MPVTLHMVTSLDGFIARKGADSDVDFSWMEAAWGRYDQGVEIPSEVLPPIDCYLLGSRTYELALRLGWPYGETRTIVVTSRGLTATRPNVEFYSGDLPTLVAKLGDQNVWLVGGAQLGQSFLRLGLVDKLSLSIVPIVLGEGVPLFGNQELKLNLTQTTAFKNGMLDLEYDVLRDAGG